MNENMENRFEVPVKWLRVLMYIAIASLINSVINNLPFVPSTVTTWISRGIMVAMIVCMFQLAPVSERYKKAGIMRAVMLVCTLITAFVKGTSILTLAASILSIIAVYQEYNAHSELIADKDSRLSGKWHSLFGWSLVAAVLVGFGSTVTVLILSFMGMDTVRLTAIIIGILSIPQMILDVVYMMYIKKMISAFEEGKAQQVL